LGCLYTFPLHGEWLATFIFDESLRFLTLVLFFLPSPLPDVKVFLHPPASPNAVVFPIYVLFHFDRLVSVCFPIVSPSLASLFLSVPSSQLEFRVLLSETLGSFPFRFSLSFFFSIPCAFLHFLSSELHVGVRVFHTQIQSLPFVTVLRRSRFAVPFMPPREPGFFLFSLSSAFPRPNLFPFKVLPSPSVLASAPIPPFFAFFSEGGFFRLSFELLFPRFLLLFPPPFSFDTPPFSHRFWRTTRPALLFLRDFTLFLLLAHFPSPPRTFFCFFWRPPSQGSRHVPLFASFQVIFFSTPQRPLLFFQVNPTDLRPLLIFSFRPAQPLCSRVFPSDGIVPLPVSVYIRAPTSS